MKFNGLLLTANNESMIAINVLPFLAQNIPR